jgi:hypothetical protein
VTTSDAILHLPHPPAAVFLSHELLPNAAAQQTMRLYRALSKASQQREELVQRINAFDRKAILPDRLWGKSTNLLDEQRTRKANVRRLLDLEAHILNLTREHEASRVQAAVALRLHWRKPRQHGAASVVRYVLQLLESPWTNAVSVYPSLAFARQVRRPCSWPGVAPACPAAAASPPRSHLDALTDACMGQEIEVPSYVEIAASHCSQHSEGQVPTRRMRACVSEASFD